MTNTDITFALISIDHSALHLLEDRLHTLLRALPESDADLIDYLWDDFHDDPSCYLPDDIANDAPITDDMLRTIISNELRDARDFPSDD